MRYTCDALLCVIRYKLHIAFLARERNEPAKAAGKKKEQTNKQTKEQTSLSIKERLPITTVMKHSELTHKQSVKSPRCQKDFSG